jgi:hypothetical protein
MISPSGPPGQPELSSLGSPPGGHARLPSSNHCVFGLPGGAISNPEERVTNSGVTHNARLPIPCPPLVCSAPRWTTLRTMGQ